MSTRSLTHIQEADGTILVTMYCHSDGYPDGHGRDLAEFLQPMRLISGIGARDERNVANGMPCFAAQLIAHFKARYPLGNIYLYPPGSKDCGEEFVYTVRPAQNDPTKLQVTAADGDENAVDLT